MYLLIKPLPPTEMAVHSFFFDGPCAILELFAISLCGFGRRMCGRRKRIPDTGISPGAMSGRAMDMES